MTNTKSLPIAVIGAGPVGMAAAAEIVSRDMAPLVFERGTSVGASLLEWSHVRVFSPWGFDVDPVLVALPNLRGLPLNAAERAELTRRLVDAARSMPEVESAARGVSVPFWSTERMGFTVPGIDSLRRTSRFSVQMASADYFETIGTRILRGRAITVNAVAPGPTATDLFLEGKSPELIERLAKMNPLERLGKPADIAAVVAFLAGPQGGWINGQVIRANGGMV